MIPFEASKISPERSLRKLRLISGLIMFIFVMLHLANHSLNLISLRAAEEGRHWFLAIWRNPVGTFLFYGAAVIHVTLIMRSLYLRRTLIMPIREASQIILGLLIPVLLIEHVVGTRIRYEIAGVRDTYEFVIRGLWVESPSNAIRQTLALLVVWAHGCIGIHFWLRFRNWYSRAAPYFLTVVILLPVLGLLGFANTGRILASEPVQSSYGSGYSSGVAHDKTLVSSSALQQIIIIKSVLYGVFVTVLVSVVVLRLVRSWRERFDQIEIRYPEGQVVRVPRGFSVLEASRLGGVPHYAVCGGKGRCSTCRVQIVEGGDTLSKPDATEQSTLNRIKADADVRLACQLRPLNSISIVPLLVPTLESHLPANSQQVNPGREQEIVILFCDIRNFTALTEAQLPYDVVFLLNRYFAIIGQAVEQAGGRLDKFIGDGAMALFGLQGQPEDACRQALKACAMIVREIDRLSQELATEIAIPLRVAIGVHSGPAIVGAMGYSNVKSLTAIGDTVNVASRLETIAKELDVTLVVSEPTIILAGSDTSQLESREITVRGRAEPLRIYVVTREMSAHFL